MYTKTKRWSTDTGKDATPDLLAHGGKQGRQPHLWDGKAAQRIVDVLVARLIEQ